MAIAEDVESCSKAFCTLIHQLQSANEELHGPTILNLTNAKQKFDLWTHSTAAYRRDKNSLEQKLRDASHIKTAVLRFINDLTHAIERVSKIVSGETVPWEQLVGDTATSEDNDDTISVGSYPPSVSSGEEDDTEISQLSQHISTLVESLLLLSISIKNPAPHDRFMKSIRFDPTMYSESDIQYVKDKFPAIEPWLAERLGRANSWRRQYFAYRERHHDLRSKDAPDDQTVVSSLPAAVRLGADSLPNLQASSTTADCVGSDSGFTQTSFQTTLPDSSKLQVPKVPDEAADGATFNCPLCHDLMKAETRSQWKKHVFMDLQPYICLHQDCKAWNENFSHRHRWQKHQSAHSNYAISGIPISVDLRQQISQAQAHESNLISEGDQLTHNWSCPMCKEVLPNEKKYYKHVGQHQQQVSLFAIPRSLLDDGNAEDEEAFDDHDSVADNGSISDDDPEKYRDEIAIEMTATEGINGLHLRSRSGGSEIKAEVGGPLRGDEEQTREERILQENSIDLQPRLAVDTEEGKTTGLSNFEGESQNPSSPDISDPRLKISKHPAGRTKVLEDISKTPRARPIHFKDAFGQNFEIPWEKCKTWKAMETLINEDLNPINEEIAKRILAGYYDICKPDGSMIIRQLWEMEVAPGMHLEMKMWTWPTEQTPSREREPMGLDADQRIATYLDRLTQSKQVNEQESTIVAEMRAGTLGLGTLDPDGEDPATASRTQKKLNEEQDLENSSSSTIPRQETSTEADASPNSHNTVKHDGMEQQQSHAEAEAFTMAYRNFSREKANRSEKERQKLSIGTHVGTNEQEDTGADLTAFKTDDPVKPQAPNDHSGPTTLSDANLDSHAEDDAFDDDMFMKELSSNPAYQRAFQAARATSNASTYFDRQRNEETQTQHPPITVADSEDQARHTSDLRRHSAQSLLDESSESEPRSSITPGAARPVGEPPRTQSVYDAVSNVFDNISAMNQLPNDLIRQMKAQITEQVRSQIIDDSKRPQRNTYTPKGATDENTHKSDGYVSNDRGETQQTATATLAAPARSSPSGINMHTLPEEERMRRAHELVEKRMQELGESETSQASSKEGERGVNAPFNTGRLGEKMRKKLGLDQPTVADKVLERLRMEKGKQFAKETGTQDDYEATMQKKLPPFGFQGNETQDLLKQKESPDSPAEFDPWTRTYFKVFQEHLDIETLKYYNLSYEIDKDDPKYIIITEEISDDEVRMLFEHTRKLRRRAKQPGDEAPYAFVRKKRKPSKNDISKINRGLNLF